MTIPAHQRLDGHQTIISQREDRLVLHPQLLTLKRPLQIRLQPVTLKDRRAHRQLKHRRATLATPLGVIHRHVGVTDHLIGML